MAEASQSVMKEEHAIHNRQLYNHEVTRKHDPHFIASGKENQSVSRLDVSDSL